MIIGVTGTLASGKDTVSEVLEKKGFEHISLSAILREILKEKKIEITVANLTKFGNAMREKHGHGFLAEEALKRRKKKNLVISSIRQVGEVETLKNHSPFYLIAVDAPVELRFERLKKRGRHDDPKTLAEFKAIEAKQKTGSGGGINLDKTMALADYKLINGGTLKEFYGKIEKTIKEIKNK